MAKKLLTVSSKLVSSYMHVPSFQIRQLYSFHDIETKTIQQIAIHYIKSKFHCGNSKQKNLLKMSHIDDTEKEMSYREEGYGGDPVTDDYDSRDDVPTVGVSESIASDDELTSKYNDAELATWRELGSFCCCHSNIKAWSLFILHIFSFFTILYFFMGILLLASSAQVLGSCFGAHLLAEKINNPISNVMAGIIATSIFQSSKATTFMIGSLAGNGLTVHQIILHGNGG